MAGISLSIPMKVSLPCLLLGAIFFVTSFSVNYWLTATFENDFEIHGGLWRVCGSSNGVTACRTWSSDTMKNVRRDWMHKNQALQCLALILMVGTVGALVVFLLTRLKAAIVTAFITCFMSALFMVVGCALYATDLNNDAMYSAYGKLGWAFGFNIVAACFLTAGGVGLVLHVFFWSTTTTSTT